MVTYPYWRVGVRERRGSRRVGCAGGSHFDVHVFLVGGPLFVGFCSWKVKVLCAGGSHFDVDVFLFLYM